MKESGMKFDWGEVVLVSENAPAKYRPNSFCSVVGKRIVENKLESDVAGVPIGTGLYVIEFPDGKSVELEELYLCKSPG